MIELSYVLAAVGLLGFATSKVVDYIENKNGE
jgi:hypothetical protein